mmetsp:Transcript_80004/g.232279  ORF Transcript_80004/g.232279 Transcript_80004/m.232279 type:complete len:244 (+) Transcript_80004:1386-2117(+)
MLIGEPDCLVAGVLLQLLESLVHDVRAIVGRGFELLRLVNPHQFVQHEHRQHEDDNAAGRQFRQLLADTTLAVQLVLPHVDIQIVPVVLVVARLVATGRFPLLGLVRFVHRFVELQDAHQADDPDETRGASSDLGRARPANILQLLLVSQNQVVDDSEIQHQRDRGDQIQDHEEAQEVIVLPEGAENDLDREDCQARDGNTIEVDVSRLVRGEQLDIPAAQRVYSEDGGEGREQLILNDHAGP